MTKTKSVEQAQGAESTKPKMQLLDEKTVRSYMEKDMKAAKDLLSFILATPEIMDMVASFATGVHNNRVNEENLKSQG